MLYGLKALDTVHLHEQKKSRCHTPPLEPTPLTWSPCRPDCWGCAIQGRETCYAPLIVVKSTVSSLFFFNILYLEYSWFNNIVTVSKEQQRDSAIHRHVSILPQTALPSKLPHDIEQSSSCSTAGPCWFPILIQQCVHAHPKFSDYPFPPPSPAGNHSLLLPLDSLW